jgi:hypothetical protein
MNPEEFYYDEEDKKLYLALQKAGKVLPCDIEEVLDERYDDCELPEALKDVDATVEKIMSGDALSNENTIPFDKEALKNPKTDSEWAMAARHGAKLSDASREKIRKLRESKDESR